MRDVGSFNLGGCLQGRKGAGSGVLCRGMPGGRRRLWGAHRAHSLRRFSPVVSYLSWIHSGGGG